MPIRATRTAALAAFLALPTTSLLAAEPLPDQSGQPSPGTKAVHNRNKQPRKGQAASETVVPSPIASRRRDNGPETVEVTGRRRDPVVQGGALGNRRVLDTPFSIRTVTAAELQERQVKSLARVFSEDASLLPNGNTYSFNSYSVTVRGVPLDDLNGYKINGQPFYMTTVELPLESFEDIQLLKGASGFMYGFNAPGGLINFETKKPPQPGDKRIAAATLSYSSDSVVLQNVDLGGRVGNEALGYRVNLTHEQGRTYNGSNVRRYSGSVGLDAHLAPSLYWTADAIWQDRRVYGGIQGFILNNPIPYVGSALPGAPSGDRNFSAVPSTFFNSEVLYLASGLRWDIAPGLTGTVGYSHSYDWRRYAGEWPRLRDQAGDFTDYLSASQGVAVYDQVQAMLNGHLRTGPFTHEIIFGGAWQGLTRLTAKNSMTAALGPENLYQPLTPIVIPHDYSFPQYRSFRSDQAAVFLSDTISLGKRWSLIAGGRFTDYRSLSYSRTGGSPTAYTVTPLTPVAALLYHPWRDTTLYVSYVQALEDGGTVGDIYKNAFESLPPLRSDQVEVGAKIDRRSWAANAAVYRINRGAQYVNADNVYVSDGNLRLQGFEADGHVDLPYGFTLTDSVAWEEGIYQDTEADLQGNRVEGIPRFQNKFQITDRIPFVKNLSATAEVQYVDGLVGNANNSFNVPAYVLVNLRVSYVMRINKKPVMLRAEIDNIANKHFWGWQTSDYLYVGEPRTAFLSARVEF
ncbi:TonB-dependent siderophore receptor [Rhizosaccharibacter radicis]|uniref:TonB-dependent siderophore receptor n=1 Tax=Rhizosaccharibacter radicis TaxID=2782605 RepID=A0ABT1VT45_9PROT|nr:TonB-dependent siderophore receptor [Acetobacteraceae bacterium KSS12]